MRQIRRTRRVKEMSQKTIMKTLEVPVNQLKPSPYQPRMTFNLEDIRGSIQRDGILIPLTVRKKDGYYELVDGERRTRLAKELGYKTIPVTVIDVDDDTARRMVWKVNTLRQDYTPKEKAFYFQKLQKPPFGMSLQGMARETDMGIQDVKAYLNVLKLPEDYQEMVWDRVIPIRNVRELDQLFNGVTRVTLEKNPELFAMLDRSSKEKHFGAEQIREALKPYLTKFREEQIEKAKEAVEEIAPIVRVPETPEELEEAATVLRREAKRKREETLTPKEKAKIETEKKRKEEERHERAQERKRREEGEVRKRVEEERKRIEGETRQKVERELLTDEKFLGKAAVLASSEVKDVLKNMEPEIRALILNDKAKLPHNVIVAVGELKEPELQKKVIQFIQTHGYNEDYALRFIDRAKEGDLVTDVTVMNEAEEVLRGISGVYETIASWGVNERMILGSRWNEALRLFDKIEEKIRELRETHFYGKSK
jgi:ParB/RepB/Spo0J family partition protein